MRAFLCFWLVTTVACGSSSGERRTEARESIPECDAYVATYERCLTALGPDTARIAGGRAAVLRASLAPPEASEKRDALRNKCVNASRQFAAHRGCR